MNETVSTTQDLAIDDYKGDLYTVFIDIWMCLLRYKDANVNMGADTDYGFRTNGCLA